MQLGRASYHARPFPCPLALRTRAASPSHRRIKLSVLMHRLQQLQKPAQYHLELHHDHLFVYLGGDPSQCPTASRTKRHGVLAQACSSAIMPLQRQDGDVYMCAARARVRSSLGDTAVPNGKDDSKGEWSVQMNYLSAIF